MSEEADAISIITVVEKDAHPFMPGPLDRVCQDVNMLFTNILIECVNKKQLPVSGQEELRELMRDETTRLRHLLILELPLQHAISQTPLKDFPVEVNWESPGTFVIYVDAPEYLDGSKPKDDRVLH